MTQSSAIRKSREGAWLWLFKILGGPLIVVLLGVHFIVNHLVAPGGLLTYDDVVQYYTNPVVPLMEIIFLVVVIAHSLIGLRSIVLDMNPPVRLLKAVDWAFIFAGVGFSAYGIWLVWVMVQRGM